MILIGDDLIPFENISKVTKTEDIKQTTSNSTVIFDFEETVLKYCFDNQISSAVIVFNIKEAIYSNSLKAKYIICSKELAQKVQKIADNYMFDSRILVIIESNNEIEEIALNEIDGVIYKKLV